MYGRNNEGKVYDALANGQEPALVDHLLTASINCNGFGTIGKHCLDSMYDDGRDPDIDSDNEKKDAYLNRVARTLLRAAYEATYLAAIFQRRKKLFLTVVGGGSFSNPVEIVVDEMKRAHNKWANHRASRLESCQVCLHGPGEGVRELLALE